jgi:hypothetical protein
MVKGTDDNIKESIKSISDYFNGVSSNIKLFLGGAILFILLNKR